MSNNNYSDATADSNCTALEEDEQLEKWYAIYVPLMIGACVLTFLMNATVLAAFPFITNLSKVTRPYITFIFSLVISDAFASFLLGFQLLTGSYLPLVAGIAVNNCLLLGAEGLKLVGIIVTVFHLLVMVTLHLGGVINPVKFKEHLTIHVARFLVVVLWLIPFLGLLIPFALVPEQGLMSPNCTEHSFLAEPPFRITFSALILVPTVSIIVLYGCFHTLLWRNRDVSTSVISKQNIRAAGVTFLIMLTCFCGWLPAVFNHLLICESGCRFTPHDFSRRALFVLHAVGYILVILKSFANPLIFALRQANIQQALLHMLALVVCCCNREGAARVYRAPSSRYNSFTSRQRTSTVNRSIVQQQQQRLLQSNQ